MTPTEFYEKFGIDHPELKTGQSPSEYAKRVEFVKATKHGPINSTYSYSSSEMKINSTSNNNSLYSN